ncbi:MAG: hypothetical protein EOM59_14260 [Clostridia bacterium]|nr:hypothetical protein [Clostridia bacterium]
MHAGSAAWWDHPDPSSAPWHDLYPKRKKQAVTIISINRKENTALIEWIKPNRLSIQNLVCMDQLSNREF